MGSKIKKIILFCTIIFCCFNFFIQANGYPSNAMVKVCIMDNSYKTTDKGEVSLYGTNELIFSDSYKNEFLRLPYGVISKITRNNGIYKISYIDENGEQNIEAVNDIYITCPNGVTGIDGLIRGGKPAMYRGEIRLIGNKSDLNKFYLINCLDVEYYLKGVVPCEMPVSFGLEALKAQAVAARNYSLSPRTCMNRIYDVVDSVASQVYNGYNRESDIANKAIDETHGLVALYDDEMIISVFSSTAGGYTESYSNTFSDPQTREFPSKEKPYLTATPDLPEIKTLENEEDAYQFYSTKPQSYDIHSPLYRWKRVWSKEELENVLKNTLVTQSKTGFVYPELKSPNDFGNLKSIKVTKRGKSGKIIFVEVETDKNKFTLSKELVIRRCFTKDGKSLPSANAVFKYDIDETGKWSDIVLFGGGFGHGSGMSQYGAMYMARDCKMSFETILKHYYKGIKIGTKPVMIKNSDIVQCFYAPKKQAILVITDKKKLTDFYFEINEERLLLNNFNNAKRIEADISDFIKEKELNTIKYEKINSKEPIKVYIYFK